MDFFTTTSVSCTVIVGYLCLVRALRWQRYHAVHKEFQAKYENKTLMPEEAQRVMHLSACYDMPTLVNYATAFALFKTYGIPSISKLLLATKALGSRENVTKRYADTEILISTWFGCPIYKVTGEKKGITASTEEVDPRAMLALARVNWLHSRYNISNDDFLYTLGLFIFEPPTWAARYGWRALSQLECYSFFIFWVEIGKRMGIQDIPENLEEFKAWTKAYEEKYMIPAPANKEVARYTLDEILSIFPEALGIKHFADRVGICLLDERVRIAMIQEAQPWYIHLIALGAMHGFGFLERWLLLPRRSPWLTTAIPMPKDTDGRLHPAKWQSRPYYKPESKGFRYYVDVLAVKVGFYQEMPGPQLKSQGYRLEELGPASLESKGHQEVMQIAEKLQGCPVTGPWSMKAQNEHYIL